MTPDELCAILGRQRTSFGEDIIKLQPGDDAFILQTYYFTYNNSTGKEKRRVRRYLQDIRQLSCYIWILVATSLTYTHLAHLRDFDRCLEAINSWKGAYPTSEFQESSARAILRALDNEKDKMVNEGQKIGRRISQRKITTMNSFPIKQETNDPLSCTKIPINNSTNERVQEKWKFLLSIDAMCGSDETGIMHVTCDQELDNALMQPFETPLLWRNYTQQYPLRGTPSSIPEFIEELRQLNVGCLEVHNYAAEDTNYLLDLDDIMTHFKAPLETSDPLNFLDIRNQIISCVPVHVNKVDLLRLALRRQEGSAGKARPLKVQFDYADHEFFLISSRLSLSPLHSDTGGKLTYVVGISGCKTWYLPRKFTTETYEILATFGSSTPETYSDGWVKVDIMPGDLLIMPPGCPHAVFTPEHSLTYGGNFYTLPHLGASLRILAIQAKFNHIFSNESLTEQDYLNFLAMLETCKDSLDTREMASIASSGIAWGITDQHEDRKEVSKIRWDEQEFWALQERLRLQIFDIQSKGYAALD